MNYVIGFGRQSGLLRRVFRGLVQVGPRPTEWLLVSRRPCAPAPDPGTHSSPGPLRPGAAARGCCSGLLLCVAASAAAAHGPTLTARRRRRPDVRHRRPVRFGCATMWLCQVCQPSSRGTPSARSTSSAVSAAAHHGSIRMRALSIRSGCSTTPTGTRRAAPPLGGAEHRPERPGRALPRV